MGVIEFIIAIVALFCIEQIYVNIVRLDLKRLNSWSKEIWQWLCSNRNIFGCIVVPFASMFTCWKFFEQKDTALIVASGILQLAGMMQAMISLLQVWKYFQKDADGMWQVVKMKFREFPKWKKTPASMTGHSCIGSKPNLLFSKPEGEKDNLNESCEKRINAVVQNQKMIFSILEQYNVSIATINRNISISNEKNNFNFSKLEKKTEKKLETLHLGDFIPTLVGIIWISLGIIMATIGALF